MTYLTRCSPRTRRKDGIGKRNETRPRDEWMDECMAKRNQTGHERSHPQSVFSPAFDPRGARCCQQSSAHHHPSIHPSIPSQTHRFHPRPWVAGSQHTLRAMCLTGVLFACVRVCGCGRHGRLKRDAREPGNAEAGACLRMTQVHSPHSRMVRSLIPGDRDFSQVSRPFVLPGADFARGKISLRTRWKSGASVWRFMWRWVWR